jgi:phosphoribosylanthranilate isomerase
MVKICGVRGGEDGCLAVALGASHVGSVMVESSPRSASVEQAREVRRAVEARARHVLVFRDQEPAEVLRMAREVGTRHVQIYGASDEDSAALEERGLVVYRVVSVAPSSPSLPDLPRRSSEKPVVLDVGGGGSGLKFSWDLFRGRAPSWTFIAGGIRPENVEELLQHRPYGIDLSSGVERSPGIKDPDRMRALFHVVWSWAKSSAPDPRELARSGRRNI